MAVFAVDEWSPSLDVLGWVYLCRRPEGRGPLKFATGGPEAIYKLSRAPEGDNKYFWSEVSSPNGYSGNKTDRFFESAQRYITQVMYPDMENAIKTKLADGWQIIRIRDMDVHSLYCRLDWENPR